jgi:hypothetical protein
VRRVVCSASLCHKLGLCCELHPCAVLALDSAPRSCASDMRALLFSLLSLSLLLSTCISYIAKSQFFVDVEAACILPSSLPSVGTNLTTCLQGTTLAAGESCQLQCALNSLLQGGSAYRCSADGSHWLEQQRCVPFSPVEGSCPLMVDCNFYLLTLQARSNSLAQAEMTRHVTSNSLTSSSGWTLLALAVDGGNSALCRLWVSHRQNGEEEWVSVGNLLPFNCAFLYDFVLGPMFTVDSSGRLTTPIPLPTTGAPQSWISSANLTQSVTNSCSLMQHREGNSAAVECAILFALILLRYG